MAIASLMPRFLSEWGLGMRLDCRYIYIRQQVDTVSYPLALSPSCTHPHTHTHKHTHLNVYPEHEGAVTAVGVSEDGLKVLAGTSSVSQTTTL